MTYLTLMTDCGRMTSLLAGMCHDCIRLPVILTKSKSLDLIPVPWGITGAWREFEKAASAAPNLDALLQSHSEYLTTLLRKSLLDERCEGLRVVLTGLVGNAIALRGLVGRFADQVGQRLE